jgi:hypothetical protein
MHIIFNNKRKLFSMVTFFFSLNILLIAFIFLHAHRLLINAWSLKLIQLVTTSSCVLYTSTWKHFTSSLWINIVDFISQLLHIINIPSLAILTPFCSPCTPSVDYAHLFVGHDNTCVDCTNFSVDYANKSDDCVNTLDDWANIVVDSVDTLDKSSLDL